MPPAKLEFIVGTVSSGKTLELIMRMRQLENCAGAARPWVIKPEIDVRYGRAVVKSAVGISVLANHVVSPTDDLTKISPDGKSCIFVDEIQFFSPEHIDQLRAVTRQLGIPVCCYGLDTDYMGNMFPGSRRLMEVADEVRRVPSFCAMCESVVGADGGLKLDAVCNLRIARAADGTVVPIKEGKSIVMGGIESFIPVCKKCYCKHIHE